MKYVSVPFDINLFFDIINESKKCYILKEKDRILHYIGYDSYNVKFVFANKSVKKSYITIDPSKIHEVISIMKMIPDIGMCIRDKDFVKVVVNKSNLQSFIESDNWEPITYDINEQFKLLHNLDIVLLSNDQYYLYVTGGYFINRNITIHKDNFNENTFIKRIFSPVQGILPNGFNTVEQVFKDSSYTKLYDYLEN